MKDRYRAIKPIGQGGFGRTFLAVDEDKPSKPRCVIKQFFPQAQGTSNVEKAAELFEQEAIRLDELGKHAQIPELLAYFTQDQRQYLVQEFIDGQNLAEVLQAEGAFKELQIRELLNSLLPVLDFIHTHNVIHRDIKPENIIRRPDGQLVLVDFGAAKFATGTALLKTGTRIGSPEYVAPEQAKGKATFASDLYSLGVTCIHLLTELSPFDLFDPGEDAWIWQHYLNDNAISNELSFILNKLIENAILRRYQSAQEILRVLNFPALKSVKGIDYQKLQDLLATEKWQEADLETVNLILQASGRVEVGWLRGEDMESFSTQDLHTIDQLWVNASSGRFGFKVQKQIWQSVGGNQSADYAVFRRFGDRVGWLLKQGRLLGWFGDEWIQAGDLKTALERVDWVPEGYLPCQVLLWCGGGTYSVWPEPAKSLLSRRDL
jgi:serine/threonine protein kinase